MQEKDTLRFGGNMSMEDLLQGAQQSSLLGALCFATHQRAEQVRKAELALPVLHVPMAALNDTDLVCERWSGLGPLQAGRAGDLQYQYDEDVLFGVVHLPESVFQAGDQTPLQQATESAYRQIFALIEELNFPYIFRFWNYIADINTDSYALERYRQFNMGRYDAFLAFKRDVVGSSVPAACALGYTQGGQEATLCIAFLAGRVKPTAIENPRQMSAYEYPLQYGPVSPTFSRASLVKLKQSELLLISGTASVVGHATQHPEDAVVQTNETMVNIEAILTAANSNNAQTTLGLADLHYRAYVRDAAHVKEIHKTLVSYIGKTPEIVYLQADICRQDLLLEIEATAEYPLVASAETER